MPKTLTIPELARVQDWLLRYVKEQDLEDVKALCYMATLGAIKLEEVPSARTEAVQPEIVNDLNACMFKQICLGNAKDAARWRWLVEHVRSFRYSGNSDLTQAIDAAMRSSAPEGKE